MISAAPQMLIEGLEISMRMIGGPIERIRMVTQIITRQIAWWVSHIAVLIPNYALTATRKHHQFQTYETSFSVLLSK